MIAGDFGVVFPESCEGCGDVHFVASVLDDVAFNPGAVVPLFTEVVLDAFGRGLWRLLMGIHLSIREAVGGEVHGALPGRDVERVETFHPLVEFGEHFLFNDRLLLLCKRDDDRVFDDGFFGFIEHAAGSACQSRGKKDDVDRLHNGVLSVLRNRPLPCLRVLVIAIKTLWVMCVF